jgi:hypothetical protein
MSNAVLADMQGYATGLKGYLTTSLTTTPDLPDTRPSIDPKHALESFAKLDTLVSDAGFTVQTFHNGFVPMHLADYDIPVAYTDNGVYGATKFDHATSIKPMADLSQRFRYAFYLVQGTQPGLGYRWQGGPSMLLPMASGTSDPAQIKTALARFDAADLEDTSTESHKQLVLVNAASGQVVSNIHGTYADIQTPFAPTGGATQLFGQTKSGASLVSDVFQVMAAMVVENDNPGATWLTMAGGVLDVDNGSTAAGTPIGNYSANGGANQAFVLVDVGNGLRAIVPVGTLGLVSVSKVCPSGVVTCGATPWLNDAQPIVVTPGFPVFADATQLFRVVPVEFIDAN